MQKQTVLILDENTFLENALRTLLQELVVSFCIVFNGSVFFILWQSPEFWYVASVSL